MIVQDMVDFILEFSVNECRLLLTVFYLWRYLEILALLLTIDVLLTKSLGIIVVHRRDSYGKRSMITGVLNMAIHTEALLQG